MLQFIIPGDALDKLPQKCSSSFYSSKAVHRYSGIPADEKNHRNSSDHFNHSVMIYFAMTQSTNCPSCA